MRQEHGDREKNTNYRKITNTRHNNLFDQSSTPKRLRLYCGVPKDEGCTQPFSNGPKIKLEAANFSYDFLLTRISVDWSLLLVVHDE